MIELAHFVQFFSLSFGLVAIYIGFTLYQKHKFGAIKSYLYLLIGINMVIFIHVLEAFLKLITPREIYDSNLREIFLWIILLLAALRLFIAIKFLKFSRQLIDVRLSSLYNYLALAFFLFFILMGFILQFNASIEPVINGLSVLSIHFWLLCAFIFGSVFLLKNADRVKIISPGYLKPFIVFIVFYSLAGFLLRVVNFQEYRIQEDHQMFYLGLLALIFNVLNILYLKKMIKKPEGELSETTDIINLYKKFGISKREKDIIQLICEGKTNKEIGELLFISPITVRDYCSKIYRKTNTNNRTQVAGIFMESRS